MNIEEIHLQLTKTLKFTSEDIAKLSLFHDELLRFNNKYNLISKSTEKSIWDRHILDSAQLVKYIDFNIEGSLSDMGSGAGFPGLVLAIFNKNPKFHVKLFEKSNVKCDFLENVKNKLKIDCDVFGKYQEEQLDATYIVSRAFKKLKEVLRISREIVKVNHKLIILKGKRAGEEINKLQQPLEFMYKLENSLTDHKSKVLIVDVKK